MTGPPQVRRPEQERKRADKSAGVRRQVRNSSPGPRLRFCATGSGPSTCSPQSAPYRRHRVPGFGLLSGSGSEHTPDRSETMKHHIAVLRTGYAGAEAAGPILSAKHVRPQHIMRIARILGDCYLNPNSACAPTGRTKTEVPRSFRSGHLLFPAGPPRLWALPSPAGRTRRGSAQRSRMATTP